MGSIETRQGPRGGAALQTFERERSVMPAMCPGIIERCVEAAATFMNTRSGGSGRRGLAPVQPGSGVKRTPAGAVESSRSVSKRASPATKRVRNGTAKRSTRSCARG